MHMTMTSKLCSIGVALALAGAVQAQSTTTAPRTDGAKAPAAATGASGERRGADRKAHKAEEERIEQQAKAAKEKCEALQGNAQDVCEKQAEAQEKIAKAELAAKTNPSQRNQRKAAEAKIEGEYEVAKEKCDDQKGEQKDACEK